MSKCHQREVISYTLNGCLKLDGCRRKDRAFKARLVACGNDQVVGVDCGLNFAALMELSTVKIILVLVLSGGGTSKTW